MTKAELLADLAAKDFVSWVSDAPTLVKDDADGFRYYNVRIRETRGGVGGFRQIPFYVVDEGGPAEEAFFQGADPFPTHNTSEFRKWMLDAYQAAPSTYRGLIVHHIDELAETAILSWFAADWTRTFYYVERDSDGQGTPLVQDLPGFDLALLDHSMTLDSRGQ